MRFKNKVVLITGASRGLGKAMAEGFAEEGAKIIVSSRKLDACEAVAGSIKARGGDAIASRSFTCVCIRRREVWDVVLFFHGSICGMTFH